MKKGVIRFVVLAALSIVTGIIFGCVPKAIPPNTFVTVSEEVGGTWKTIELRSDLSYEDAWQIVVDSVTKRWDIEIMNDATGYLKTDWAYESGIDKGTRATYKYGRRITIKFLPDKKSLRIRTEAYYEVQIKGYYYVFYGMDSRFNEDAFNEISGKLARTTR